ncbi:hypothetical protein HPB48_020787 [Haemaphysalis longicornis]|uniref:FP protein C-terminal domain-containing protein n=1 Tax=Haemaphysalis longicornis TaxID=44386 RepID=A0A9J6FZ84_HAELO|nr:hypothetical protein HPB48_020787 [Haemaphysalis longicornis]
MAGNAKEIMKALEDFKREMRTELRSVKDSVKFCSDTCDETKAIGAGLKALRQEIAHLLEANEALQDENKRLTRRVDELEQYTRLNNLEIKGISSDEDPVDVVKKIGDVLKEPVSSHDIDTCHRIPTRKPGETNIVVRFVRRDKRHALLAKARKQKLTTKQLGLSQANAVYVNEHLTQANKQLLGAAIARKKEVAWKFVWTSAGKVFARKDEHMDAVRIQDLSDLTKMTK